MRTKRELRPLTDCRNCRKSFHPTFGSNGIFCSIDCSNIGRRKPRQIATCGNCGVEFEVKLGSKGEFCSQGCVSRGRSQLDEARIIELYAKGLGLKAIAKEVIGRDSAKNTARDALRRNGVTLRTSKEMANDPASKLRRLKARGVDLSVDAICGRKNKAPKQKRCMKGSGLELFEYVAQQRAIKHYDPLKSREQYERSNDLARGKGFKSNFHMRYETERPFRIKEVVRRRLNKFVSTGSGARIGKLIGCSWEEFRTHIEKQWEEWMTWENLGGATQGCWQIDHIVPCSWFDHEDADHLAMCWHHMNLRPLCAVKNNARRNNPNDLIETLSKLPDSDIKCKLLAFAQLPHL